MKNTPTPDRKEVVMRRLVSLLILASVLTLAGVTTTASAATGVPSVSIPYGICDVVKSPRTVYMAPPVATAVDLTNGTDTNTIRYWVRFVDADTNAGLTDWVYGGQGNATDTTPAVFPTAYYTGGYPYWVYWTTSVPNRVKAEYFLRWYRADGSEQGTWRLPSSSFKLKALVQGPWGPVPGWTGYPTTCGPNPGY